jgi:hypothetical protein
MYNDCCFQLEKKPEDYSREDCIAINEYEKAVVAWNDERLKYKKILEKEKANINQQIEENVNKFDNNVFNLFQIKLKYNAAINQEYLKIIRLSKMLSDSDRRNQQIKLHKLVKLLCFFFFNGV